MIQKIRSDLRLLKFPLPTPHVRSFRPPYLVRIARLSTFYGPASRGVCWIGPSMMAFTLYSSLALIDELAHTLHFQKFVQCIGRFGPTPSVLVAQYVALVTLASPTQVPRVMERDAEMIKSSPPPWPHRPT
jgi:hypothetical protein